MKVEELIEKYSFMDDNFTDKVYLSNLVNDLKEIREQQEVEIPQFIADFITEQKKLGHTLSYSIDACMSDIVAEWYWDNSELFARAWLDGYTVEKEKQYTVKIKGNLGQYLGKYYLNNKELTPQFIRTQKNDPSFFTKAELEEAGFGWVFDCEGIEVEEVKG